MNNAAHTIRNILVALLLVGGIAKVATTSSPARAADTEIAPAKAATICKLGQSC